MQIVRALTICGVVLGASFGMMLAQDGPPAGAAKGKGGGRGKGGGIPAPLVLTVAGYADGTAIPASEGCAAGQNTGKQPKIDWTGAPAGTAAFALIMHDPDVAIAGSDVLHWAIFDIPGTATGLAADLPKTAQLADGSVQLNNIGGSAGFFNPCPPAPTTHHYVIELYALDAKLGIPATTSRADLEKALAMHTRAKGVYVGTFHQ